MTQFSLKRFSLLLLLVLTVVSFGCHKKAATPPPPPPVAPPPPPPPPAPTVTLSANPATITAGQSSVLSYTSTNATAVTISGIGAVQPPASGTRTVNPTATASYTATATGPGGTATSAAVSITVNQPPPPPRPPAPTPPPPPRPTPPPGPTLDQLFTQTMVPVLFDFDKYNIRPDQESKVLTIASWLKQNATVRFTIEGHADERGSQEYNIALGDERAAAVKKYLAGQGVAENRMNTVSYGEERPVCRDMTEDCWQRNRRAAFIRIP